MILFYKRLVLSYTSFIDLW